MTAADVVRRADTALAARVPAAARTGLGAVGAALTVVGALLPWDFDSSFPPDYTVALSPVDAQLYAIVLAVAALLGLLGSVRAVDRLLAGGSGGVARAASWGSLAVVGLTLVLIATELGGLANVNTGGWLALVGSLLLVVASRGSEVRAPRRRTAPAWVEILALALAVGLVLYAAVTGLEIDDAEPFTAFLLFLGFLLAVLVRAGVTGWLSAAGTRHRAVFLIAALLASVAFPFTQGTSNAYMSIAANIGLFAATAIGLNIVVGLAGLLDLGYIAFFGIGSYVAALLSGSTFSTLGWHPPFIVTFVLGAAVAAVFGVLIGAPTLRLRGDYLAIVTLGFGEIFRIGVNNLDGTSGPDLTNGPNGISNIPNLDFFGYDFGESHTILGVTLGYFANYYFLEIVLIAAVVLVFSRVNRSRVGRAWVAIREDETAASAMGINTTRLKLLAFALGATLAGAAGTINAPLSASITPDQFQFLNSTFLVAAVVLGGMGTVGGALVGSVLLLLLPEKLRFFDDKRLLLFGLALVVMMRFRPEGIIASRRRQQEFHDPDDREADALSAPPGSPVAATTRAGEL